jgi:hypothetical protein
VDVNSIGKAAVHGGSNASKWIRDRVVAVCTDGRRQFWSKVFLQSLYVLRSRWELNEMVCMPESELLLKKPEIFFPAGKTARTKDGPVILNVPKALQTRRQEPIPPLLPERLPCPITYEQSSPWTRILDNSPAPPPSSQKRANFSQWPQQRPRSLEDDGSRSKSKEYLMMTPTKMSSTPKTSTPKLPSPFPQSPVPSTLAMAGSPHIAEEKEKGRWNWRWPRKKQAASNEDKAEQSEEVKSKPAFPRMKFGRRRNLLTSDSEE